LVTSDAKIPSTDAWPSALLLQSKLINAVFVLTSNEDKELDPAHKVPNTVQPLTFNDVMGLFQQERSANDVLLLTFNEVRALLSQINDVSVVQS